MKEKKFNMHPPSSPLGTVFMFAVLLGMGFIDNLYYIFGSLLLTTLMAGVIARGVFRSVYHNKEVLFFFLLTGISLLLTAEGRRLAPVLLTKMFSMWLWVLLWIHWAGFERILSSLEGLGVPSVFVNIIDFTARFIPILSDRVKTMFAAQASRGAKKGIHPRYLKNLAGGIGSVLLSSFEQSENVERAMRSRGFCGERPVLTGDNSPLSYGSLIVTGIIAIVIWAGVICNVLCNNHS